MLTLQKGHLLVMYTNRCDASSLFMQAECFVGLHQVSVELQSNHRRNAYILLAQWTVWRSCM